MMIREHVWYIFDCFTCFTRRARNINEPVHDARARASVFSRFYGHEVCEVINRQNIVLYVAAAAAGATNIKIAYVVKTRRRQLITVIIACTYIYV